MEYQELLAYAPSMQDAGHGFGEEVPEDLVESKLYFQRFGRDLLFGGLDPFGGEP